MRHRADPCPTLIKKNNALMVSKFTTSILTSLKNQVLWTSHIWICINYICITAILKATSACFRESTLAKIGHSLTSASSKLLEVALAWLPLIHLSQQKSLLQVAKWGIYLGLFSSSDKANNICLSQARPIVPSQLRFRFSVLDCSDAQVA